MKQYGPGETWFILIYIWFVWQTPNHKPTKWGHKLNLNDNRRIQKICYLSKQNIERELSGKDRKIGGEIKRERERGKEESERERERESERERRYHLPEKESIKQRYRKAKIKLLMHCMHYIVEYQKQKRSKRASNFKKIETKYITPPLQHISSPLSSCLVVQRYLTVWSGWRWWMGGGSLTRECLGKARYICHLQPIDNITGGTIHLYTNTHTHTLSFQQKIAKFKIGQRDFGEGS